MTRILVDPRIAFGRPYVEGSGVLTAVIRERWLAGESKRTLARDYELPLEAIDAALDFERSRRRNRQCHYQQTYSERVAAERLANKETDIPGDFPRAVWSGKGST